MRSDTCRQTSGIATAYDQAFWWSIGFTALAVVLALALPGRPAPEPDASAPEPEAPSLSRVE